MSKQNLSGQKTNRQKRMQFIELRVWMIVATVLFMNSFLLAQQEWNTNGNNIFNTNSGNVGIGTDNPRADLEIFRSNGSVDLLFNKNDSIGWRFRHHGVTGSFRLGFTGDFVNYDTKWAVMPNGNVGIGTLDPRETLEIRKDGAAADVLLNVDNKFGWRLRNHKDTRTFRLAFTNDFATYSPALTVKPNGDIGFGTLNPQETFEIRKDGGSANVLLNTDNKLGWRLRSHLETKTLRIGFSSDFSTYENHLIIDKNGHVGIGRLAPDTELDVNGTTRTKILEIIGGNDLAEPFAVEAPEAIQPGMVVAIDPEQPGQLRLSQKAYDRTVAGIVSGAGGIRTGMVMRQVDSEADGKHPVALSGRVYCLADASNGPIQPGDLLTTSDIPGYAMKVTDYSKAQGAVLGKAMSALESGRGLVFVLVTLQ